MIPLGKGSIPPRPEGRGYLERLVWARAGYNGTGFTILTNLSGGTVWSGTTPGAENCRVLYNGYLYGPTSSGFKRIEFSSGTERWSTALFGTESSVILAKDQLVILAGGAPNGHLVVAKAVSGSYQEVYRTNSIMSGQTWACPTLANGRIYLRNNAGNGTPPATLVCFDVSGDLNRNGIDDDWETAHLPQGTNTVASDSDNDSYPNLWEYIAGTDPTNGNSRLRMDIQFVNGKILISYPSIQAAGTGYQGWSRLYDLEMKTNLLGGNWQPVPGATNVLGTNAVIVFANSVPTNNSFYRVKVRLD